MTPLKGEAKMSCHCGEGLRAAGKMIYQSTFPAVAPGGHIGAAVVRVDDRVRNAVKSSVVTLCCVDYQCLGWGAADTTFGKSSKNWGAFSFKSHFFFFPPPDGHKCQGPNSRSKTKEANVYTCAVLLKAQSSRHDPAAWLARSPGAPSSEGVNPLCLRVPPLPSTPSHPSLPPLIPLACGRLPCQAAEERSVVPSPDPACSPPD